MGLFEAGFVVCLVKILSIFCRFSSVFSAPRTFRISVKTFLEGKMEKGLKRLYHILDILYPITFIIHWALFCDRGPAYLQANHNFTTVMLFCIDGTLPFAITFIISKLQVRIIRLLQQYYRCRDAGKDLADVFMRHPVLFILTEVALWRLCQFILHSIPALVFPACIFVAICYVALILCIGRFIMYSFTLYFFKRGEREAGKAYDLETGEAIEVTVAEPIDHRNPCINYDNPPFDNTQPH